MLLVNGHTVGTWQPDLKTVNGHFAGIPSKINEQVLYLSISILL